MDRATTVSTEIDRIVERWLMGTHQAWVDNAHLASNLNEFVFRFNRRHSRSRGLVFYCVSNTPLAQTGALPGTYHQQAAIGRTADTATGARSSAEPATSSSEPALENRRP